MALTYEPIATTTLSVATASIDFTSIPQTYTDLRIVSTTAGVNATAGDGAFTLQYNNNLSVQYSSNWMKGDGSNVTGGITFNVTSIAEYLRMPNASSIANTFAFHTFDIFNYTDATVPKQTLVTQQQEVHTAGSFSDKGVKYSASRLNNNFAITSILFTGVSQNFRAGTSITIYGIKAA